jgi:hypothetical protein
VGSWDLWWQIVVEPGCIGCAVAMVASDNGCNWVAKVAEDYGSLAEVVGWIGVRAVLPLARRQILPLLLLVKDADGILQLCQPCVVGQLLVFSRETLVLAEACLSLVGS